MSIMQLVSGKGFILCNKKLAKDTSLDAAVLFGQLASNWDYYQSEDKLIYIEKYKLHFFFRTVEELKEDTTLSHEKQQKALKLLEKIGLVHSVRWTGNKLHYHINEAAVISYFLESELSRNQNPKSNDSRNRKVTKPESELSRFSIINKEISKDISKKNNKNQSINKWHKDNRRDAVIEEVYQEYAGLIDEDIFRIVLFRCLERPSKQFKRYLRTALTNEIKTTKQQQDSSKAKKKVVRKEQRPIWSLPESEQIQLYKAGLVTIDELLYEVRQKVLLDAAGTTKEQEQRELQELIRQNFKKE